MTPEQEIAMHARIHQHWKTIGDEKRKELQAAMTAAARVSAEIAKEVVANGFNEYNRALLKNAAAKYERAAIAYYGE